MGLRNGFVYVLHFEHHLGGHAEHYIGCTEQPVQRLTAHAAGAGSRITRALREKGYGFRLGTLATCNYAAMRRIERDMKGQHNASRYCALCHGDNAKRFPDTTPYPYDFDSRTAEVRYKEPVIVSMKPLEESALKGVPTARLRINEAARRLMKVNRDCLGFVPAGDEASAVLSLLDLGQMVVATSGIEVIGYCSFTLCPSRIRAKIQQTVVDDAWRLQGIGRRMVQMVKNGPWLYVEAAVKDTLAATQFWEAEGFKRFHERNHKTSGNKLVDFLWTKSTTQATVQTGHQPEGANDVQQ